MPLAHGFLRDVSSHSSFESDFCCIFFYFLSIAEYLHSFFSVFYCRLCEYLILFSIFWIDILSERCWCKNEVYFIWFCEIRMKCCNMIEECVRKIQKTISSNIISNILNELEPNKTCIRS